MRVGRSEEDRHNKNDTPKKYNIAELYSSILSLEYLYENIILVNPYEQRIIDVHEYALSDSHRQCTDICPLKNDALGCICKDAVFTDETRCRFIYNKSCAFLVTAKKISMQYRDYTLVMIMKLNPNFQFGANSEVDAIESITKLSSSLIIDPLTKIFNRKYLMDNIDYMVENSLRESIALCLACIDIDNFKRFNDTYGHEFGDVVLKEVANNMVKATASIQEAYNIRIGGDEFLIVAINVDKKKFRAIMNNLCILIDSSKLQYKKELVSVKISVGVAELMADKINSYKELYDKADKQLYKAKKAGKGCVR